MTKFKEPTPSEYAMLEEYDAKFGMVMPTSDIAGQVNLSWDYVIPLARQALVLGRPIPWRDLLAPLPPGALS